MLLKPGYDKLAHEHSPDLDKLVRATMDALTDVVYEDDRQVTEIRALKLYVPRYDYPAGLEATIYALSQ
jgi:Holliday junction resolvase RusA-like endonuclease